MYPHERSLVEKFGDKPFALLGVNSDPKEDLLAAIEREKITWRSWWDGGRTGGPIATKWNVRAWPTLFVIDHEGVIRYRNIRGERLDAVIKVLIDEIEDSRPPSET